jgi:hypothetical protein
MTRSCQTGQPARVGDDETCTDPGAERPFALSRGSSPAGLRFKGFGLGRRASAFRDSARADVRGSPRLPAFGFANAKRPASSVRAIALILGPASRAPSLRRQRERANLRRQSGLGETKGASCCPRTGGGRGDAECRRSATWSAGRAGANFRLFSSESRSALLWSSLRMLNWCSTLQVLFRSR